MKINWNFDGNRGFTPPCTSPKKRAPPPFTSPPRSPQISPRIDFWWLLMIFDRFWHRCWSVFWLMLDGFWMDVVRCLIKIEKRRFYENERFAYTKPSFSWFQDMLLESKVRVQMNLCCVSYFFVFCHTFFQVCFSILAFKIMSWNYENECFV